MYNFTGFKNWVSKKIDVKKRLQNTAVCYLLFLMLPVRKHSLDEASRIFGIDKSGFSKFLKNNSDAAVSNLNRLGRRTAKRLAKKYKRMTKSGLPQKYFIIIDSTLHKRSGIHTDNSQKFNCGKGYVTGHQWTNITLLINGTVIPLKPIPFYSKKYCIKHGMTYMTEADALVKYINELKLEEFIGRHKPEDVAVLMDSGYDTAKIQRAINKKKWIFISALKKTRCVKSEREHSITSKGKGWHQICNFFKNHRRAKWTAIRVPVKRGRKKRMEFRIRQIFGFLRNVCRVQLICSECKKRSDGRRKYLACNDLKVKARMIIIAYRLRWHIEIFHKQIKMFLGLEDIAAKHFNSVISHVHWVCCAYILLTHPPPGVLEQTDLFAERQRLVKKMLDTKEKSRIMQLLTQFDGPRRCKAELQRSMTIC
jgi:hypothetical protein